MRQFACRAFAFVVVVSGCTTPRFSPLPAHESIMLRPRFSPGQKIYLESEIYTDHLLTDRSDPTQTWGGQTKQIIGAFLTIDSVSHSGAVRLILTYDRLAFSSEVPNDAPSFDTDVDDVNVPKNETGRYFAPILGKPITIDIGSDGKITSLKGMEKIRQAVEASAKNTDVFERWSYQLTNEKEQFLWDQIFNMYSYIETSPGSTWTRGLSHDDGSYAHQFRLAEMQPDKAVIEYAFELHLTDEAKRGKPFGGDSIKKRVSAAGTGNAVYDVKKGLIVRAKEQSTWKNVLLDPAADFEADALQEHRETTTMVEAVERLADKRRNRRPPE